jgi:ribose transport system permease protein
MLEPVAGTGRKAPRLARPAGVGWALARALLERLGAFAGLIVLGILLSLASPQFLTANNLLTVFVQVSVVGIMAVGMTLVIITAGIDLSVGSIVGLSGVIAASLMVYTHWDPLLASAASLAVSTVIGVVNGLLITLADLPPFIVTLGMMGAARGVAFILTNGVQIFGMPASFTALGGGSLGFLPIPVLVLIAVAVAGHVLLSRTRLGAYVYAIGSNVEAARLSGVDVRRYLVYVYALCGLLSGLAGLVLAGRISIGTPTSGLGYELDVIAACVIGGTSLFGGEGTILGTIIGTFLIGIVRNGSDLLNISNFYQQVIIGVIIWGAVLYDRIRSRRLSQSSESGT